MFPSCLSSEYFVLENLREVNIGNNIGINVDQHIVRHLFGKDVTQSVNPC